MDEAYLGTILLWTSPRIPTGWALCNGASLSISQNVALYSLIGITYGGDGKTTFNLPNLCGRVIMGYDTNSGKKLGYTGGSPNVTLTPNNIPEHTHAFNGTITKAPCTITSDNSTIPATSTLGNTINPDNNSYFSKAPTLGSNGLSIYNNANPVKDVQLPVGKVTVNGTSQNTTLTINNAGNQTPTPVNNMQQYLALNYIICLRGIYPPMPS